MIVIVLKWNKSLFWYTILVFHVVCDIDFIITGNILRSVNAIPIVKPKISLYRRSLYRGFCSIHFTIVFAGQTNVDSYTGKIVKPGFHCTKISVAIFFINIFVPAQ